MVRYNKMDVVLLEAVYEKLKMWDRSHPSMTAYDDAPGCPTCRSPNTQRRGIHVAKTRKAQRIHCQDCGAWSLGEAIKKGAAA
jgi:transcription elongation factor Elf1